jgi:hypothetical protein
MVIAVSRCPARQPAELETLGSLLLKVHAEGPRQAAAGGK